MEEKELVIRLTPSALHLIEGHEIALTVSFEWAQKYKDVILSFISRWLHESGIR